MNALGDNMNPGKWTEAEIARLDFAWCKFFAPILSFEIRCEDIRKAGRQPTFLDRSSPAHNLIIKVASKPFHIYNWRRYLNQLSEPISIMEEQNALVGQEVEPAGMQPGQSPSEAAPAPESASMESLLEEQGLSLDFPTRGEIRQGVIATLRENEILVSIGTKSEGVIPVASWNPSHLKNVPSLKSGRKFLCLWFLPKTRTAM